MAIQQQYSVTSYTIDTLLNWVKTQNIAIPEIQRPFVWDSTQVRNLLDSLHQGYPIGYLISWRNPSIKLKDGTFSNGKRILIDGQQRVTALMAALLGHTVLTKDYKSVRIRIAFNPLEKRFEVCNPAIEKDRAWINDVAAIFDPNLDLFELVHTYTASNENTLPKDINRAILEVIKIVNNQVGVIELDEKLDIDKVTEIFIRVNSAGTPLSQADFAMSKIAANETHDGGLLRKAIDYFCHLAIAPGSYTDIKKDSSFISSSFWPKMTWLKDVNDDLYDPTYTDMLRVAFTSKFKRGKLQDLVSLLSGRNFETREYEEVIVEDTFNRLKEGVSDFMNKTNFDRLTMILRSSGFLTSRMIRSQNAVNFAFIIYLQGREEGLPPSEVESLIRRWYAMSILTGRYSGSPESMFDLDIRQIITQGLRPYVESTIENELPETYWTGMLLQGMETSSSTSPYFIAYQAAQAFHGDKGFLSTTICVRDLLLNRGDRHHVFPRRYLMKQGLTRGRYNQIANYVMTQSEINIAISDTPPKIFFPKLLEQINGGKARYGGIRDRAKLEENFRQNCLPLSLLNGTVPDYNKFLVIRRKLMAQKIKYWFKSLP
ncbi:MAG: DUF262 domain-containing protein [Bacteroidota bacterium]|nr:DUF262 domain-containing protein [Bacteroidota bacterium]MXW13347.1 DUF262 domain-containing protein [Rhodothermaceae bacterium]MDE2644961.1 DUF262 domain-containing protein [Bacteroidota bacterium]MXZ18455.1 DUF262 domain-containing protein [Rhodothermaceae bacterium]MYC04090.1 DUF262 domain-containing protein [Rhodothermaceae bacterium]